MHKLAAIVEGYKYNVRQEKLIHSHPKLCLCFTASLRELQIVLQSSLHDRIKSLTNFCFSVIII